MRRRRIGIVSVAILLNASVACERAPAVPAKAAAQLTHDEAQSFLDADKADIDAALNRALGFDPHGLEPPFHADDVRATAISETSKTEALASFSAKTTVSRTLVDVRGEAHFRLFDDGWHLESVFVLAK